MKSFMQKAKSMYEQKMDKRGVLGLDVVKEVIIFLLIVAVVAVAAFLALVSIQNSNLFTSGTQASNQTANIISNITIGTAAFFSNVPTIMTVLGAVAIVLAITLIIFAVNRFSGGAGSGGTI